MYPVAQGLHLDVEAISGIAGSISIACWIVVFSPQIIENFRRGSADGLSLVFIVVWLLGDVFNILGAVLQGVLPTMTILAVYYTLADIVLLGQCFYYRGFTLSDAPTKPAPSPQVDDEATEESPLLSSPHRMNSPARLTAADADRPRKSSISSFNSHFTAVDGTHLSPATPLLPPPRPSDPPVVIKPQSSLQTALFNSGALLLVCTAGVFGWWLSTSGSRHQHHRHHDTSPFNSIVSNFVRTDHADSSEEIYFDRWGQIFGYLCAVLYLGSRVPQLLLNYRRKSTEGVSMLFFLFACVGNLTYVMSIVAYEPGCARAQGVGSYGNGMGSGYCGQGEWGEEYGRYILVNASWLIGSAGTLLLDMGIFAQFWVYRGRETNRVGEE
ncbi:hypothetical protein MMC18_007471 [Xylographa bjoerkii]|nr:hypothetical protein [Xylographa bjoerkii]MCJ1394499.1 hypothetical protein [Xylographa bjoerkii]MCJ1394591.1 hypothetical protein [Xylographa bjoerkii]